MREFSSSSFNLNMQIFMSVFLLAVTTTTTISFVEAGWPGYNAPEYFTVRRDQRRCAFPSCGGFFLNPVNVDKFDCPKGERTKSSECYVAQIQGLEGLNVDDVSMVRGKFFDYDSDLSGFLAYEAFHGQSSTTSLLRAKGGKKVQTGAVIFYSMSDQGMTCITNPCNTFAATKLNQPLFQTNTLMFGEIDFSAVTPDDQAVRDQMTQFRVLVSAMAYPVSGPAGNSHGLRATNYYTKLEKTPQSCTTNRDCMKGEFCSKTSCTVTKGLCKARPENCGRSLDPVCACDGLRQFDNDCVRMLLGVVAANPGACPSTTS